MLSQFHKQANKANKNSVLEEWFKLTIDAKNYVKKLISDLNNPENEEKKINQSLNQIKLPEELLKNQDISYKLVMESLYKHFLLHMRASWEKEN